MASGVDPLDLVDPARYARDGYPHAVWTRLRAESPVAHIAAPGYEPFWAITKHADIVQMSKQPLRFSNAQGIMLRRAGAPMMPPSEMIGTPAFWAAPARSSRAAGSGSNGC